MATRWLDVFLDRPRAHVDAAALFWAAVTRTTPSPWRGGHTFVSLLPTAGDGYVRLQGVDDLPARGGVHLDLEVDDLPADATRARGLGARDVHEEPGLLVLRSPAGLPFCLTPYAGSAHRPPPVGAPASRLDQVALDVPRDAVDAETAFWQGLTGWDLLTGSRPTFRVLRAPGWGSGGSPSPEGEVPLRLLVQELGEESGPAGMHVDLATADRAATTSQHVTLGARVVEVRERWTVMSDPGGGTYCLTDRDPVTGTLPH